MTLIFYKYHGSGNDFIIIDNRHAQFSPATEDRQKMIAAMCKRHTGVGADGLMLLENHPEADFQMRYYNADGREGSLCGNGSRCIAAFALRSGVVNRNKMLFFASDGLHQAEIMKHEDHEYLVRVQLHDTGKATPLSRGNYFIDTGSPHLVIFGSQVNSMDVVSEGRKIRYADSWKTRGVNVNFAEMEPGGAIYVRTYERGVEDETLSCGTGVTAVALAAWEAFSASRKTTYDINTRGGKLQVSFLPPGGTGKNFSNIILTGPVQFVYQGSIEY